VSSVFSEQELSRAIISILGEQHKAKDLEVCLSAVEIIKPPPAKLFWHLTASSGIYIVLTGKVFISDAADNLIVTLHSDATFGEATLFGAKSLHQMHRYLIESLTGIRSVRSMLYVSVV
jgi:hypothetical protein